MKINYTLIRADGLIESHTDEFPGEPEGWYEHVRRVFTRHFGDDVYYEHVNVWHRGQYHDMFVDETGALTGKPVNPEATEIYHANVKAHFPEEANDDMPAIYGDALLFEQKVWI